MSLFPNNAPVPVANTGTFTEEDVKQALPAHLRGSVTQSLVDYLNNICSDPLIAEDIRNNFVSYSIILRDGKFKTEEYVNAVTYVTYKIMGYNNKEAYARTFPDRMVTLHAAGKSEKDISAYVSAFNKGKLVNLILEKTLTPVWIYNQDVYQKAINTQVDLMTNAESEKVRTDAANSLLTHLARPKESNVNIQIGEVETSGMKEMKDLLGQLAKNQLKMINDGDIKTIDVAAMKITKETDNE